MGYSVTIAKLFHLRNFATYIYQVLVVAVVQVSEYGVFLQICQCDHVFYTTYACCMHWLQN